MSMPLEQARTARLAASCSGMVSALMRSREGELSARVISCTCKACIQTQASHTIWPKCLAGNCVFINDMLYRKSGSRHGSEYNAGFAAAEQAARRGEGPTELGSGLTEASSAAQGAGWRLLNGDRC